MTSRKSLYAEKAAKRRKLRGYKSDVGGDVAATVQAELPAIDAEHKAKYNPVVKLFNITAQKLGGVNVNGIRYDNWDSAIKPEAGTWTLQTYKVLLEYYVSMVLRAKKKKSGGKKTMDQRTLLHQAYRILAAYSFYTNTFNSKELRSKVKFAVAEIGKSQGLQRSSFVRASLTCDTMFALSSNTPKLRIPVRQVLTVALYQATAPTTGMRSSSLLRHKSRRNERTNAYTSGLTYRDISIWVVAGDDTSNDIIVWLTPRSNKSSKMVGASFPLMSTGRIGTSGNIMLLLAAAVDGLLGKERLEDILDPKFLGTAKQPRRLYLLQEGLDKFCFDNGRGRSVRSQWINQHHKTLSLYLGFARMVLTHDFRFLTASAVYWKYDMETTSQVLQHAFGSKVSRTYLGDALKYTASTKLSGVEQDRDYVWKTTRTDALPDEAAPKHLTEDQVMQILEDPKLVELKAEQSKLREAMGLRYGDIRQAGEEDVKKYKSIVDAWRSRMLKSIEYAWQATNQGHQYQLRSGAELQSPMENGDQTDKKERAGTTSSLQDWDLDGLIEAIKLHFKMQNDEPLRLAAPLLSKAHITNMLTEDPERMEISRLLGEKETRYHVLQLYNLLSKLKADEAIIGTNASRNSRLKTYRECAREGQEGRDEDDKGQTDSGSDEGSEGDWSGDGLDTDVESETQEEGHYASDGWDSNEVEEFDYALDH